MGNCLGKCLSGKSGFKHSTDELESDLVAKDDEQKEGFIFKIMKFKKKKRSQFLDQFWENKDLSYSRLSQQNHPPLDSSEIQLQCLDVQNLVLSNAAGGSGNNVNSRYPFGATTSNFDYNNAAVNGSNNCYVNNGMATSSSRASSSLDLEWEHEYGAAANLNIRNSSSPTNVMNQSWLFLPEEVLANKIRTRQNQNEDTNEIAVIKTSSNDDYLLVNQTSSNALECKLTKKDSTNQINLMTNSPQNYATNNEGKTQIPVQNETGNGGNIGTRTSSRTSWSHISTPDSLEWDIDEEQQKQLRVEDDNLDHETLELLHEIELLKNKVLNETGEALGIEFSSCNDFDS